MFNKRLYAITVGLFLLTAACNTSEQTNADSPKGDSINNVPAGELPEMVFATDKHDFGTITEGEKASYLFAFKNDGKSDLLITAAQGSCGCTVPEYPKRPVKPGEEGAIKVTFDSHGKAGVNKKEVLITTNCKPSTKILHIQVNVTPLK